MLELSRVVKDTIDGAVVWWYKRGLRRRKSRIAGDGSFRPRIGQTTAESEIDPIILRRKTIAAGSEDPV